MAYPLYLVASGGTGAKAAEAFIHTCAAGLGPEEVHLLLIDGDASALTRTRLNQIIEVYNKLQAWPWKISQDANNSRLFKTKVTFYQLAHGFASANLDEAMTGDASLSNLAKCLLTEGELKNPLTEGFYGCPNLGTLVVAKYLRDHLTVPAPGVGTAAAFLNSLRAYFTTHPGDTASLLSVGSIFGGTGAAILPSIKDVITDVLNDPNNKANTPAVMGGLINLKWGKVMMLPYYQPLDQNQIQPAAGLAGTGGNRANAGPAAVPAVQPGDQAQPGPETDRHSLDSVFALWFYSRQATLSQNDPFFVIGSELRNSPTRIIPYSPGGPSQKGPPFYPELLAAIGLLDLYNHPAPGAGGLIVRHFTNTFLETPEVKDLPAMRSGPGTNPALAEPAAVHRKLALLFHLAAFYVRHSGDDKAFGYKRGLLQYALPPTRVTGWHKTLDQKLKASQVVLSQQGGPAYHALEYFSRLLFWTRSVFSRDGKGVEFNPTADYGGLHNTLCAVEPEDVVPGQDPNENIAACLCRMAATGLLCEDDSEVGPNRRKHNFVGASPLLIDKQTIKLAMDQGAISRSAIKFDVAEDKVSQWEAQYSHK